MIRKTLYTLCTTVASLLMLASASGIAAPFRSGDISDILTQSTSSSCIAPPYIAASTHAITPAFETLTTIHHLQTLGDVVEYIETELEDDDDVSAHFLTSTAFHSMRLAASYLANAPPDGFPSCSIPLYIMHHCWKHFPSRA